MTRDGSVTLKSGVTLFEYRIDSILGQGGFGITYKATDLQLNRTVAIKEYFPREFSHRDLHTARVVPHGNEEDRETFEWGLKRFLAEARTLARFHHPSIVAIRRFFEFNDTAYIVMDFAEGRSLSEILKEKGTLPWSDVKSFLPSLLDGLAIVHKAGVLHRDIKPANIYLRQDGTPILLDFGSASQEIVQHSRSVTSIASAGYGAVEQYSTHGKQAEYTDIYGLAATLYHVVTGKKPQDAPDRILDDKLEPASRVCQGKYPASFLIAIDNGLNVRPQDRPNDVSAWRSRLLSDLDANQVHIINNKGGDSASNARAHASVTPMSAAARKIRIRKYSVGAIITCAIAAWWLFYFVKNEDEKNTESNPFQAEIVERENVSALSRNAGKVLAEVRLEDINKISKDRSFDAVYSKECPQNSNFWDKCYGKKVFEDGVYYQGDWLNNKMNGIGIFRFVNTTYIGSFVEDNQEGYGKTIWDVGGIHVGLYKNGLSDGFGAYFYPSGERYVGEFSSGKFHGNGTRFLPNGDRYVGSFASDEIKGIGTWYYRNGSEDTGEWIQKSGEAVLIVNHKALDINKQNILSDMRKKRINEIDKGKDFISIYSTPCPSNVNLYWDKCSSEVGVKVGEGVYRGDWKSNRPNGIGLIEYDSGYYIGSIINGLEDGHGKFNGSDYDIYVGEFKNGNAHGSGVYFFVDGNRHVGEFVENKVNGRGVRYYPDGTSESGRWIEDKVGIRRIGD